MWNAASNVDAHTDIVKRQDKAPDNEYFSFTRRVYLTTEPAEATDDIPDGGKYQDYVRQHYISFGDFDAASYVPKDRTGTTVASGQMLNADAIDPYLDIIQAYKNNGKLSDDNLKIFASLSFETFNHGKQIDMTTEMQDIVKITANEHKLMTSRYNDNKPCKWTRKEFDEKILQAAQLIAIMKHNALTKMNTDWYNKHRARGTGSSSTGGGTGGSSSSTDGTGGSSTDGTGGSSTDGTGGSTGGTGGTGVGDIAKKARTAIVNSAKAAAKATVNNAINGLKNSVNDAINNALNNAMHTAREKARKTAKDIGDNVVAWVRCGSYKINTFDYHIETLQNGYWQRAKWTAVGGKKFSLVTFEEPDANGCASDKTNVFAVWAEGNECTFADIRLTDLSNGSLASDPEGPVKCELPFEGAVPLGTVTQILARKPRYSVKDGFIYDVVSAKPYYYIADRSVPAYAIAVACTDKTKKWNTLAEIAADDVTTGTLQIDIDETLYVCRVGEAELVKQKGTKCVVGKQAFTYGPYTLKKLFDALKNWNENVQHYRENKRASMTIPSYPTTAVEDIIAPASKFAGFKCQSTSAKPPRTYKYYDGECSVKIVNDRLQGFNLHGKQQWTDLKVNYGGIDAIDLQLVTTGIPTGSCATGDTPVKLELPQWCIPRQGARMSSRCPSLPFTDSVPLKKLYEKLNTIDHIGKRRAT